MDKGALFWLGVTLACIIVQSFFAMQEMAIVSFNRVRLQYYAGQGIRRARWINSLLSRSSRLFGTTLLGVNVAMQVGSECSREFYTAMHLDPDIAPITQLFLVLIFGELAPMFAARRYPERVAMFGIPFLYLLSRLLLPVIWLIGWISRSANRLVGGKRGDRVDLLLSREELQHVVEFADAPPSERAEFNQLVDNLFSFRNKIAKQAMTPLPAIRMLPSDATVGQMRRIISRFGLPCLPIYYASRRNIVAIALPRNLIDLADEAKIRDNAGPPWFITQDTSLMQILKQFRHNHRTVAVVLDASGQAVGLLTLDDILQEIFGEGKESSPLEGEGRRRVIECTVAGNSLVEELNRTYEIDLPTDEVETVAQLLTKRLGHPPEEGESVRIGPYELTALDVTLIGAKRVALHADL